MQGCFSDFSDLKSIKSEDIPVQVMTIRLTKENYSTQFVAISLGIISGCRISYINGKKNSH